MMVLRIQGKNRMNGEAFAYVGQMSSLRYLNIGMANFLGG